MNRLPIPNPALVTPEDLAVDVVPVAQLVSRPHLDDLSFDLRHRGGFCSRRSHRVHRGGYETLHLAGARLFGKPDESRMPGERFGSFARRDRPEANS